jgi:MFS family permease
MYFSVNVSFASLPVFLPTILKGMGFSSINAQGLSAPPYCFAFITSLGSTYIADRTGQRGIVIIVSSLVGAIGYTILATVKSVGPRYFAVFLAAAGMFPAIFNIGPWVVNNQGSDTKRGTGIVILQMLGSCGPILGTRLYPSDQGVYYVQGMAICAGFMYLSAILAFVLRCYLVWENKKADQREVASMTKGSEKPSNVGIENEGFGFRNVL